MEGITTGKNGIWLKRQENRSKEKDRRQRLGGIMNIWNAKGWSQCLSNFTGIQLELLWSKETLRKVDVKWKLWSHSWFWV